MAYEFGLLLDRSSYPSGRQVSFDYRILDQDVFRYTRSTSRPLPEQNPVKAKRAFMRGFEGWYNDDMQVVKIAPMTDADTDEVNTLLRTCF